jgi:hypothetical protein
VKPTDPPALATALLELLIQPRTSAALIGDLIEEYRNGRSRMWYWQQTIVALMRSALREGREHTLQASSAIVLGYLCGASLNYFTTSIAARLIGGYTAYVLILPLGFLSAAASGWIVRRTHARAMVLVWATFCGAAGVVALAVYAVAPIDRMPVPMAVVVVTVNAIAPIAVLAGGLLGAPHAKSHAVDAG